MKFPISWLKEWVDVTVSPEVLAERLTMAGLEVDSLDKQDNDACIEIELTPNRVDCTSIVGISAEVAALLEGQAKPYAPAPVAPVTTTTFPIRLNAGAACPHYAGRIIEALDTDAQTPDWMQARLEACGIRSVQPVVDILNYVMLESGQPMHAFDADKLDKELRVELSTKAESLTLLDDSTYEVPAETLMVRDTKAGQAVAGIMGAAQSAVSAKTKTILLESAYFHPEALAGKSNAMGLHSESSYRFERGIHPARQLQALERASALILEICGGQAGPVMDIWAEGMTPVEPQQILLRRDRIKRILGIEVSDNTVETLLQRLGGTLSPCPEGWQVIAPLARQDWKLEIDLIEEIARIVGFDNISTTAPQAPLLFSKPSRTIEPMRLKLALVERGYQEIISYSFVDPKWAKELYPQSKTIPVENPISADKSVMRPGLWVGLLQTVAYHQRRQQDRLRLFETGLCFEEDAQGKWQQVAKIGGVIAGKPYNENWSNPSRAADFFDIKGDIERLIALSGQATDFRWEANTLPGLHPGQSAQLYRKDKPVGWIGRLHPAQEKALDLAGPIYVFELEEGLITQVKTPQSKALSKYPSVRRDLALLVKAQQPVAPLCEQVEKILSKTLQEICIFDVYVGKGVPEGYKSLGMGLILQESSRTLLEEDVDTLVFQVVEELKTHFGAQLRD